MKKHWSCLSALVIIGLIGSSFAIAQEKVDHKIILIDELVAKADSAIWVNGAGNQMSFDAAGVSRGSNEFVQRSKKVSQHVLKHKRIEEIPDEERSPVVEVAMNARGVSDNVVRGKYEIQLPDLKHIQLEMDYDLYAGETEESTVNEFFVEIEERDPKDPARWIKTSEINQPEEIRAKRAKNKLTEGDLEFSAHSYGANLTKWAGKNVRIVLASKNKLNRPAKGRWTNARLVGATFSITVGNPE